MSELEDIWHRTPEDRHSDELAEAYRRGRAEAFEEAAKVAEGQPFGWSNTYQKNLYVRWPWRESGSSTEHSREAVLAREIAAAIRALAKGPKKCS